MRVRARATSATKISKGFSFVLSSGKIHMREHQDFSLPFLALFLYGGGTFCFLSEDPSFSKFASLQNRSGRGRMSFRLAFRRGVIQPTTHESISRNLAAMNGIYMGYIWVRRRSGGAHRGRSGLELVVERGAGVLAALELARVLGRRCSGEQGKASPKSAASSWAGVLGNGGGRGSIGALRSIIRACANLAAHIWSRKS